MLWNTTLPDTSDWSGFTYNFFTAVRVMLAQPSHSQDSNTARYYNDVSKTEILDAKTERELFRRYRRKKDPAARERILHSALRFVIKLARRYGRDPDMTKDLISAGNIGLLKAFDRYDPKRGTRFLSYAASWVLLEMRNELYNAGTVTMPLWRQKALGKISQTNARALVRNGCVATAKELEREVDLTPTQLKHLQECEHLHITDLAESDLLRPHGSNGYMHHPVGKMLDGLAINKESRAILGQLMRGNLTSKEQFVVKAYFGWVADPMSLRQIASVLVMSSERVRQIKTDALERLERKLRYQLDVRDETDIRA